MRQASQVDVQRACDEVVTTVKRTDPGDDVVKQWSDIKPKV